MADVYQVNTDRPLAEPDTRYPETTAYHPATNPPPAWTPPVAPAEAGIPDTTPEAVAEAGEVPVVVGRIVEPGAPPWPGGSAIYGSTAYASVMGRRP